MSDPTAEDLVNFAMANLHNYCVKLAPSKVHGIGVFAIRDILKDTVVMAFSYRNFPCVEIHKDRLKKELMPEVYKQIVKNWSETPTTVLVPLNVNQQLHYVNFLNHSENSNVQYLEEKYLAKRNILKGEEILIDFNEDYYNPHGIHFKNSS